jgi:hypothetical protein
VEEVVVKHDREPGRRANAKWSPVFRNDHVKQKAEQDNASATLEFQAFYDNIVDRWGVRILPQFLQ